MTSTPSTNEWIQDHSSQNKFNTLKDEYSFVKRASSDELKQIYPKMDRKEILKEIEIEAKLKGITLKQRSRSRSRSRSNNDIVDHAQGHVQIHENQDQY